MNEAFTKAIAEIQEQQIKPLEEQIRPITDQINAKKKLINSLCEAAGEQPMYPDVEGDKPVTATLGAILPDQYFGKPTATVVRDILERRKNRGLSAIPLNELYEAMKAGGFEFDSKDPETARRSVAITLGKNTQTFIKVPSTGYWGLAEWYPGAKRNKPQAASTAATAAPASDAVEPDDESPAVKAGDKTA